MLNSFYTNIAPYGDYILYRGIENGRRVNKRIRYKPRLFIESKDSSIYHTLEDKPLKPINFESIKEAKEFVKKYSEVPDFKIYGMQSYAYAYISDTFKDQIQWDKKHIRIFNIDIEVASENGFPVPELASEIITAITIRTDKKYYVFSCVDYTTHLNDVVYFKCSSEIELLNKFIEFWEEDYPDIVTGWNVRKFDIPYLVNRMKRLFDEDFVKKLSPWAVIFSKEISGKFGSTHTVFDMYGIAIIDYLEAYQKFAPNPSQAMYTLDHIAKVELGMKKVSYHPYKSLYDLYVNDPQRFIEYNIHDVTLVDKLDEKLNLLNLVQTLAYYTKVNFADTFMQTRMWDTIIYNKLLTRFVICPPKKTDFEKEEEYEGAYVKEPVPGFYNWIVSFDLTSLYPHLIMQWNLSPETLIRPADYSNDIALFSKQSINVQNFVKGLVDTTVLKDKQITISPNNQFFRTDIKGFLPELMEDLFNLRDNVKKKMLGLKKQKEAENDPSVIEELNLEIASLNTFQMAIKVCLNSAYGSIGNEFFRYFDVRIAEAVTTSGQFVIQWIERKLNEYLNKIFKTDNVDYIIASDTDSVYINLSKLIDSVNTTDDDKRIELINQFCSKALKPFIDKSYKELAEYVNAYAQKMHMKQDIIASKAIWTGKKRYLMKIHDKEEVRFKKPEIEAKGLDVVRSSTPEFVRDKFKDAFDILMNKSEEDMQSFIREIKKNFREVNYAQISFPKSVKGLKKYSDIKDIYTKGCPIQVRAALLYNHFIDKYNIGKSYKKIKDGDKIKYVYLKIPNHFQEDVIGFIDEIPTEFQLVEYIDYITHLEKSFLNPLKKLTDLANINLEKKNSLKRLFK